MRTTSILALCLALTGCTATGATYAVTPDQPASLGAGCDCHAAPATFSLTPLEAAAPATAGACAVPAGAQDGDLVSVPAGAPTLGARYEVGPMEATKSAVMIPAEAVVCTGNYLKCLLGVFFPTPAPSLHYVNLQPMQTMRVTVPRAAKACAPAPKAACAPVFTPPAKAPGCEPVAACTGPECCPPSTETAGR